MKIDRQVTTVDDMLRDELNIYAGEFAKLYSLLKSRSNGWLEAEDRLLRRGRNGESIHQMLSAAYISSQLLLDGGLSREALQAVADRLQQSLKCALENLREYRGESGSTEHDDLGLAALLRQEVYGLASVYDWEVQVEAEVVRPSTRSETVAYVIVRETLQQAATNPRTRSVTLSMQAKGDLFVIKVIHYRDGLEPAGRPGEEDAETLTRLYARAGGGICRWRTLADSQAGSRVRVEMELTLPLGTSERDEESPPHQSNGSSYFLPSSSSSRVATLRTDKELSQPLGNQRVPQEVC